MSVSFSKLKRWSMVPSVLQWPDQPNPAHRIASGRLCGVQPTGLLIPTCAYSFERLFNAFSDEIIQNISDFDHPVGETGIYPDGLLYLHAHTRSRDFLMPFPMRLFRIYSILIIRSGRPECTQAKLAVQLLLAALANVRMGARVDGFGAAKGSCGGGTGAPAS